jgi:hypothetical protein
MIGEGESGTLDTSSKPGTPLNSEETGTVSSPNQTGTGPVVKRMESSPRFYFPSLKTEPLRQAEILSGVLQYRVVPESVGKTEELVFDQFEHRFVIVLSQDCDLAQDFNIRNSAREQGRTLSELEAKLLPNVLLCELFLEAEFLAGLAPGSDIRKRVIQNKDERYQYLHAVSAECDSVGEGLTPIGIDFRRHFTIRTDELYAQLDGTAIRRCRLANTYLEHLSCRFAHFLSRVALPVDHDKKAV